MEEKTTWPVGATAVGMRNAGTMATELVIEVRGLRKSYGTTVAVDGLDLEMERGEVLSLLGPNGAGKTTTVEVLEGYRRRDAGEARVLGEDPRARRVGMEGPPGHRPADERRCGRPDGVGMRPSFLPLLPGSRRA